MTETFSSGEHINQIAADLNAGHREAALVGINHSTQEVLGQTDYPRVLQENLAKFLQGDPQATKAVETSFGNAEKKELNLWQAIKDAAQAKNPHGLCQLTIVDDKVNGKHAEINGAGCK